MNNYARISDGECPECGGLLHDISTLNKEKKQCESCHTVYYRPDDMGPGSWVNQGQQIQQFHTDKRL